MLTTRMCFLAAVCIALTGCGDGIRQSSPQELARFRGEDEAGPAVDMDRVLQAKIVPGPYRAGEGDVLRVEIPKFPDQLPTAPGAEINQICTCRIGADGMIVLPVIGALVVRNKCLTEIETAIATQYYPKYVASPLPIYVTVQEYQTQRVSILGAVTQPGIHALRHDQMSLVGLLMQAGGINSQGAAVIRINRAQAIGPGLKTEPIFDRPSDRRLGGKESALARRQRRDAPYHLPETVFSAPAALRSPLWRAVFEWEGPLRTTGWLRVEQENGQVTVRKWLDIANGPQRRDFLGALTAQVKWPAVQDLDARLASLGAYLETLSGDNGPGAPDRLPSSVPGPAPSERRSSVLVAGWWILEPGRFATALYDLTEPLASSRTVAGITPVDVTGAVGSARGDIPRPVPRRPGLRPLPSTARPQSEPDNAAPGRRVERNDPAGATDPDEEAPAGTEPRLPAPAPGPYRNTTPVEAPIQTLVLPVRGLNIPFTDVILKEGDTVVVEPPREQWVSVLGLVRNSGNMPYPPGAQISLIQAIAFAGGLDLVADPRYVSVYRLAPNGEVVSATFQLVDPHRHQQLTGSLALPLKPGDVVSVEHTLRTRTNVFFDRVFRINLGLYLTPEGLWNGN